MRACESGVAAGAAGAGREAVVVLGMRAAKEGGLSGRRFRAASVETENIFYPKIFPRLKRQMAIDMTRAVMAPRMPRMGRICRKDWPAQRTALKPSIDQ